VLNEQGSNVCVGQAQCKVSGSKLQDLGIILQNLIFIKKDQALNFKGDGWLGWWLLATAAFWVRIQTSLKNTKWAT
jgi:hypothetical protein